MLDHGLTCIIAGNGPSLNTVPFGWLGKYPTFGANRCYLKFAPTYYVCINPLVCQQNKAEIQLLPAEKFIRAGMGIEGHQLVSSTQARFSFEPLRWVHEGYTVTYVSMQLAYWMGFRTVLLVGVDHRYTQTGKPNEKQVMTGDDPNHFDPSYFRGQAWNLADLNRSAEFYKTARDVYASDGRHIINLGPDSALDIFEKGDLEQW
jgi:hypothetical protein